MLTLGPAHGCLCGYQHLSGLDPGQAALSCPHRAGTYVVTSGFNVRRYIAASSKGMILFKPFRETCDFAAQTVRYLTPKGSKALQKRAMPTHEYPRVSMCRMGCPVTWPSRPTPFRPKRRESPKVTSRFGVLETGGGEAVSQLRSGTPVEALEPTCLCQGWWRG